VHAAVACSLQKIDQLLDQSSPVRLLYAALGFSSTKFPPADCRIFNIELPATVVFDYPTPSALAAFCAQELNQAFTESPPSLPLGFPAPAAPLAAGGDLMVLDACFNRFSADRPSPAGDGFELAVVPFGRWDVDTSAASNRLGGRVARWAYS
jgi:hypothetical protein